MIKRQLVTGDEATVAQCQHIKPCSDCPFTREALRGWLGSMTLDEWLRSAHGEAQIGCHVYAGAQCAGAAIYRANCAKSCHTPGILKLPKDRKLCFSNQMEFKAHHSMKGLTVDENEEEGEDGENEFERAW